MKGVDTHMKKKYSVLAALLLSSTILAGVAQADDDEEYEGGEYYEDEYEEYEGDEYYENEDENYYENNDYTNYTTVTPVATSSWNVWTKETSNTKGDLPFSEAKNVKIAVANSSKTTDFYVIPRDGEFFVPAKKVAEFLGADTTFYPTSKILEVKGKTTELIFRAGTNVVYELDTKTALPSEAFYMNNEVYVPISVMTNGLGYAVEWQDQQNTFACTQL